MESRKNPSSFLVLTLVEAVLGVIGLAAAVIVVEILTNFQCYGIFCGAIASFFLLVLVAVLEGPENRPKER